MVASVRRKTEGHVNDTRRKMHARFQRILLVGMVLAFRVSVYPQGVGPNHLKRAETHATNPQREKLGTSRQSGAHDPGKKADEAVGEAVFLRQKQTEKDLIASVEWFQKSVRHYKTAGSYSSAADAEIQTGEVYF